MNKRIEIREDDITVLEVDAIVNAANSALCGGGGVDGAIHRTAGPALLEECRSLGGAKTGQAKLTRGYDLPANYIIHAVGPVWRGGDHNESAQLASCYLSSLSLAVKNRIASIAFPAISTGAYRFPVRAATEIAIRTTQAFIAEIDDIEKVIFCCFSRSDYDLYIDVANRLFAAS